MVGELAGNYSTVVLMFGFAVVAMAPALLVSRMLSPRKRSNPVKFLPMECGQVPSGAGRTHFMMQYYPYILSAVRCGPNPLYDAVLPLHPHVCSL